MWNNRWIAFDTETTGFGPDARIIEAAIITFEGGEIVDRWESFFCPTDVDWEHPQVKKALEVNQITVKDLEGQPRFEDVFADVYLRFTNADVWVGHNLEFDERMFSQEFARVGVENYPIEVCMGLDTMHFSYHLEPSVRGFKLADVAARWDVTPDGLHRAASDAITSGRILHTMFQRGRLPTDIEEMRGLRKKASLAWHNRRRW
jgi:DNA polymerase III epsilon subunit-like protein